MNKIRKHEGYTLWVGMYEIFIHRVSATEWNYRVCRAFNGLSKVTGPALYEVPNARYTKRNDAVSSALDWISTQQPG